MADAMNNRIDTAQDRITEKELHEFQQDAKKLEQEIQKMWTDRIKKYLIVDGEKPQIKVEAVKNKQDTFEATFDYTFKNGKGEVIGTYPITLQINIRRGQNNAFLEVAGVRSGKLLIGLHQKIQLNTDRFDMIITNVGEKQKNFEVKFDHNKYESQKALEAKILAHSLANTTKVERDEALENTQLTDLNSIQLSKDLVRTGEEGYYRPLIMQQNGTHLEVGRLYFDTKGEVDQQKTTAESQKFTLLGVALPFRFDFSAGKFAIDPASFDALKQKVVTARKKISQAARNTRIGNPKIFEGLNNEGGIWTKTKNIGLDLINETFSLQWGKERQANAAFPFLLDATGELKFKDYKGDASDKHTIKIDANQKTEYKEVSITTTTNGESKLIITNENADFFSEHGIPTLMGEVPSSLKTANFYALNPKEQIGYFAPTGENIATIPAERTDKNLWKLKPLQENVDNNDLFDPSFFKGHNLNAYNLGDQQVRDAYMNLLEQTGITLTNRPVIKVKEGDRFVYRKVTQAGEGKPFKLERDTELEKAVADCNKIMSDKLNVLKTLSDIKLTYKDKTLKTNEDFHGYIGGKEGIGLHALKGVETSAFIKSSPKSNQKQVLSRLLTWGDGEGNENDTQEIKFVVGNNGKIEIEGQGFLFFKPKKVAGIEQKTYTIRYFDKDGKSPELVFETK